MNIKNSFGSFGSGSVLKLWLGRVVLLETKTGLSGDLGGGGWHLRERKSKVLFMGNWGGGGCNLRERQAKKHAVNYSENNYPERRITTERNYNQRLYRKHLFKQKK